MAVLVTGGAGYIGSHMVWELLDAGEEVVVLDRLSTGFEWAVAPEAKLVVGDVGDSELVGSIIRDTCSRRHHPFRRLDRGAGIGRRSARLLREQHLQDPHAARDRGAAKACRNFIFSSTAAVYGGAGLEPVREDARLAPESPYGLSKLMSEWMLRDAATAQAFAIRRCATSTSPAPTRGAALASRRPAPHI